VTFVNRLEILLAYKSFTNNYYFILLFFHLDGIGSAEMLAIYFAFPIIEISLDIRTIKV